MLSYDGGRSCWITNELMAVCLELSDHQLEDIDDLEEQGFLFASILQ